MSNLNDLKPIVNLNPFARFCCTIGNLPSSYMASLSFEEQLMWFCDYLQNTVIPAVNNNAQCVKELQELYVKLKNYVDNYFNNLDVQNEINIKLDKMAEDGTLDKIINQQIFGDINQNIENLNNNITKHIVVIGDSFSDDIFMSDTFNTHSWVALMNLKNFQFHNYAEGGSGFTNIGIRGKTFVQQLQHAINDLSQIDFILVVGGYNDKNCSSWLNNSSLSDIITACDDFRSVYNNIQNKPPLIVCGCNAGKELTIYEMVFTRDIGRYWNTRGFPFINIDRLLQWNDSLLQSDNVHPSSYGQNLLKAFFTNILIGGNTASSSSRIPLKDLLSDDFNLTLDFTNNGSYHIYGSVSVDNLTKGEMVVVTSSFPSRLSENKLIANIVGTLGYLGRIEIERNKISYFLLQNSAGTGLVDFYYVNA